MYKGYTEYGTPSGTEQKPADIIQTNGDSSLALQDESLMRHAEMHKDGQDLVLETAEGQTIIQDYYAGESAPDLVGADGRVLTPQLVESFLKSDPQYADAGSLSDESPVGSIQELNGPVTITRLDGSVESAEIGSPVYQGDIVETALDAAVNITFIDETNFAVSGDSRLSIDEYVFDPNSNEGKSDFSILKGLFVYTSGLIGREDPDDVNIDTPMGSIGIRGTIIAGNADSGEVTVVEGAIVLRDLHGNEMTLANQFETAIFEPAEMRIRPLGQLGAQEVSDNFDGVSSVAGELFSSLQDAANDDAPTQETSTKSEDTPTEEEAIDTEDNSGEEQSIDEDSAVDATDALMQGEGSNNDNIMEMNAAKDLADALNEALKDIGGSETTEENDLKIDSYSDEEPFTPREFEIGLIDTTVLIQPPDEFFSATTITGAGTVFSYDFNDLFTGNNLTFDLGSDAINFLTNPLRVVPNSVSFDSGALTFTVGTPIPTQFDLRVSAIGDTEETQIFSFNIYSSSPFIDGSSASGSSPASNDLETYSEATDHVLNLDNTRIFLNDSPDVFVVSATGNDIHMGENGIDPTQGRIVELTSTATDNLILGGTKNDTVIVRNTDNIIDTLGGNDVVQLDLTQPLTVASLDIDLGANDDSYAQAFAQGQNLSNPDFGFGDVFQLDGNGGLNLSNVPNLVERIESIQFNRGNDQDLTLSLDSVFSLSDSNVLVIGRFGNPQAGADSDLNLTGGAWVGRDANNDGDIDTETFGGEAYEIWDGTTSGGEAITLLVDQAVDVSVI